MTKYSEQGFEDAIKKQYKKRPNNHVFKASMQYRGGIPDLYISPRWIELKYFQIPKTLTEKLDYMIPVKLTEQQRNFLRKEQKAGGKAGWSMLVQYGDNRQTTIVTCVCPEVEEIPLGVLLTGQGFVRDDTTNFNHAIGVHHSKGYDYGFESIFKGYIP